MKWRAKTTQEKIARYERVRKWFAWYPVKFLDGDGYNWHWLEFVNRRRDFNGFEHSWSYSAIRKEGV